MKNGMELMYYYSGNSYIQVKTENENLLFKKDGSLKRKLIIHCVSKDKYETFNDFLIRIFGNSSIDINIPENLEKILQEFRWIGNKIFLQVNIKI